MRLRPWRRVEVQFCNDCMLMESRVLDTTKMVKNQKIFSYRSHAAAVRRSSKRVIALDTIKHECSLLWQNLLFYSSLGKYMIWCSCLKQPEASPSLYQRLSRRLAHPSYIYKILPKKPATRARINHPGKTWSFTFMMQQLLKNLHPKPPLSPSLHPKPRSVSAKLLPVLARIFAKLIKLRGESKHPFFQRSLLNPKNPPTSKLLNWTMSCHEFPRYLQHLGVVDTEVFTFATLVQIVSNSIWVATSKVKFNDRISLYFHRFGTDSSNSDFIGVGISWHT